ncbi:MAG: hypothetical protein Q3972_05830 [Corynebacterium sp.]|nr:hypothetical protein [Corynebacterium sp.]
MFSKIALIAATVATLGLSSTLAPVANAATTISNSTESSDSILAVGKDNIVRTVSTSDSVDNGNFRLDNKLNLQPGDTISVSPDLKTATLILNDGTAAGTFVSPTIIFDSGMEVPGVFSYDEATSTLTTSLPEQLSQVFESDRGCWRGTAAKWGYRGAGALVCGATGVANVVAGAACGLAWSAGEDAMKINSRAC